MRTRFTAGDAVQTAFGKGVVREVRNGRRLLVDVQGRSLVLREDEVSPLAERRSRSRAASPEAAGAAPSPAVRRTEVDLHGLTVDEAIARSAAALNDAMLGDLSELRLIHGRSGGRIRAALHAWLRKVPGARFHLDPRNPGVTVVSL